MKPIAIASRGCPSLSDLRGKLKAPGDDPFWTHLRTCVRCLRAAITLDPNLMVRIASSPSRVPSVVEPELYGELSLWKRGGMYQTWRALDRRLGREVVIKGLIPDEMEDSHRQVLDACLRREALILASLQHPSIVTLLEAGQWRNGETFYAMVYIEGESLKEAIERRGSLVDRLSLLPAFTSVVNAIAYSHQSGVVHRDLSPNNILVGRGMATVIDWTMAKQITGDAVNNAVIDAVEHPSTGPTLAAMGTPGYAAPEQGSPGQDTRVDIFTLGATLQFLVTGRRPFPGVTDEEVLANVASGARLAIEDCPRELVSIIDRAMETDPTRRYQSADEFARDLELFQSSQLVLAHRYTALQRFVHSRYFRPIVIGIIVAIVAAVGLAGTLHFAARSRASEATLARANRLLADKAAAEAAAKQEAELARAQADLARREADRASAAAEQVIEQARKQQAIPPDASRRGAPGLARATRRGQ